MSPALARRLPFLTSAAAVVVVLLVAWWNPSPLQRWEAITYDWRVRLATHVPSPAATNLGFVFMRDESIASLADGLLGSPIGLYWPRHVYGRVVDELTAQGAQAIAFDILFAQKRDDHAVTRVDGPGILEAEQFVAKLHPTQKPLRVDGALYIESDDYLAWQLHRSGRAIVAAERTVPPLPLLGTNALAWGDVSADRDPDGVLRRARPFQMYREWHPLFLKAQSEYGIQLNRATITPRKITLPRPDDEPVTVDLDAEGCFAAADFVGATLPPGMPPTARPFRDRRVWQIGIALAAIELGLDLDQAVVEPGRIRLRGPGGDRDLPLTREGTVLIDWALSESSPAIHAEPVEALLEQNLARVRGERSPTNHWHGAPGDLRFHRDRQ
jgi:hypothetical protein